MVSHIGVSKHRPGGIRGDSATPGKANIPMPQLSPYDHQHDGIVVNLQIRGCEILSTFSNVLHQRNRQLLHQLGPAHQAAKQPQTGYLSISTARP